MIEITQKDILRSTIVEPAWYEVHIDSVGQKSSKDGGSTNFPIEATVIRNADTGSTDFAGVPLEWNFNSKAIGFVVGFLKAFGVEVTPKRFDLAAAEGKNIEVYVKNGEWQGRTKNEVTDQYRPLRETVNQ